MNENLLQNAISPILESPLSLREQRLILNQMFALAVSNISENETDNFTAKKLMPVYLAISEVLENLAEKE
ncbi:MAG: hypothetical protein ABI441_10945 [Flavobacterium sp.]